MSDKDIFIVGYPKSGNSWVSRLIADALDATITGFGTAVPLSAEDRGKTEYTVRQLHLKPVDGGDVFLKSAWEACIPKWDGEKIIHVVRDPRDIVISAMHYWEIPTVGQAIEAVCLGEHPLKGVGSWYTYVLGWEAQITKIPVIKVYYEVLQEYKEYALELLLRQLSVKPVKPLEKVMFNQSIELTRQRLAEDGDSRPYGKAIQLKNVRKGTGGEWKEHFTEQNKRAIGFYVGSAMKLVGYDL